jgi:hypothetical protein
LTAELISVGWGIPGVHKNAATAKIA